MRTSSYPDSTADNYLQTVRYEIYPHTGDWNTAGTINRAFAFVHPLFTAWLSHDGAGKLPTRCSFVKPMDDRVIVTAVKRAEDDNDLVVRMYEPSGKEVATVLKTWWPVFSGTQVNFVEEVIPGKVAPATDGAGVSLKLQGNEIQTLKLNLKTDASIPLKGTRGPTPVRPF